METVPEIRGVICPIVTPFDERDRVDLVSTRRLIDFLLAHRIAGLMVGGTTGEGMLLTLGERKALCEAVVEHVAGRVPVIAHTGCIRTAETIELTRHARDVGATAASMIVPYFFSLDDEALFRHFTAIAEAVPDFPLFLYTFPGNAKNDISASLFERLLRAAPNIVGIKSSNPSLIRLQEYIEVGGDRVAVFCGVDGLMLPALTLGARGQISGNANVFPEVFCDLYEAFLSGDQLRALSLQRLVNRIRAVFRDGVTPAYFKAGLRLRGISVGRVRAPMRELKPEESQAVEEGLRALGLIEA